jgi:hypothetical protein
LKQLIKKIILGNHLDVIVQAIKNDDLAKFRAELETLLTSKADTTVTNVTTITAKTVTAKTVAAKTVTSKTVTAKTVTANTTTAKTVTAKTVADKTVTANTTTAKTVTAKTVITVKDLIDMTLDEYGNNLWTLAAENGTEEIMNFLLDMISSWPNKDLDHVLHFWTRHREHSCMSILETSKTTILDFSFEDLKFKNLKKHLNINTSHPSELREYLIALKKHLDTTVDSLDNSIRNMNRWDGKRKTPNQLRRTLVDLRNKLILNDLEWHHNSLTGIVSQSYPPDGMIVQRIIKLEIKCHKQSQAKATFDENHIENGGEEGMELVVVTSKEDKNKPFETFLSCIYKRVGKSPCTVDTLKMASQKSTSAPKQKLIPSFFSRMMKRYPFLICLSLFFFSLGLLVLDISTDVKLVWDLYHTELKKMNITEAEVEDEAIYEAHHVTHVTSQLQNFYKNLIGRIPNIENFLLGFTLFTIILPMIGYFVSWLISNNMGFATLKSKVFFLTLAIMLNIKVLLDQS